jgi:pyrroline-5-carboxylate reductase
MRKISFIGGGHMASAIIGGLLEQGHPADGLLAIEPSPAQRAKLAADFGIAVQASADVRLAGSEMIVWAVKPQSFAEAAAPCAPFVREALHLSVMAGIRLDALIRTTGAERVVRAMPNTPALIGRGIAGLYAASVVSAAERSQIEQVLAATGECVWVTQEHDLDAVTALSGSGPAYVFYLVEAMMQAGVDMGLSEAQSRQFALSTLAGATALAQASTESPAVLRERVTSKGGTTHAAVTRLDAAHVKQAVVAAILAAQARARELGDEYGRAVPPG